MKSGKMSLSQFGTISERMEDANYEFKPVNNEKNMMSSFEHKTPNIPKVPVPQRRVQSSSQQFRKPIVSKKFLLKMVTNNVVSSIIE